MRAASDRGRGGRSLNFIFQGSLLAIAGIIVRIIGMIYRVPLTAIIGTEGNGYYTSAYSIYSILLILSSYSMPTAISRIISGNLARERYRNINRVMRAAFLYGTVVGVGFFLLLWFGAPVLAEWIQKPFCEYALRALAPTVWIMAYLGILRGYFQGNGNMVPTAVSQILEQIVNAIVSLVAASIMFDHGKLANLVFSDTEYTYAFGAEGGCIGTGAGAMTALCFFLVLYFANTSYRKSLARKGDQKVQRYRDIAAVIALTMFPILISSTVYNISTVLDDYIFGNIQAAIGRKDHIVSDWGVFGEYRILFNIPVAFANSISSSLIPSLARAVERHDGRQTVSKVHYSIRFTMLIAIPATFGMLTLADPICRMLFPGKSVGLLINVLRAGGISIIFFSLSTITNGILQGLGYFSAPLKNAALALAAHVISLVVMLYLGLGIYAVMYSNILFAFLMCVLNHHDIRRHVRLRGDFFVVYILPAAASTVMSFAAYGIYYLIFHLLPEGMRLGRIGSAACLIPAVLGAVLVYFMTLLLLHAFSKEDLDNMPMGGRLKRFVH